MTRQAIRLCILALLLVTLVSVEDAVAQVAVIPTTTLKAETSNNTSASSTFKSQTDGNIGSSNVSKSSMRNLLYAGSATKIYASVMPWFGSPSHINVGYTSSDPKQIASQISDMQSRGIQGTVIPWYGSESYNATMALAFMQGAEAAGNFEFSLRVEGDVLQAYAQQNGCDVTTQFINELNYIARTFYTSSAYTKVNGRPVIHLFGIESYYIDWSKVRSGIVGNPIFMVRNRNAFSSPDADGGFSWVEIDGTNPSNEMLSYLDGFYTAAHSSTKMVFGSIYKGFNDTLASWSANRILNQQCGGTWLDTFGEANKYYSASRPLSAIQVVTWNDYEEGTEIETGIDNCVSLAPVINGSILSWNIGPKANERTIDHYTIFISTDGQNLMPLADRPAGTHSLDLSAYDLASGTYVLYVKAIGVASIVNHMSPAVAFNPKDQAPIVLLSVNPSSGAMPLTITASSADSSDPDGAINSVSIDFGDGMVSSGGSGFSASHAYQARGTFNIVLTVIDNAGVFATAQQQVTVAAGPGVVISSPTSGATLKSPVHVVASGSMAGGVSSMEIFLDGAGSHAYSSPSSTIDTYLQIAAGVHTLRVVAHDTSSASNSIYSDVTFTVGANDAPPNAVLTVEPFSGNQVLACTAQSTDSDGYISSSKINFGDGVTASGPTALHSYSSSGTYQVLATVTDNAGLTSAASSSITVGGSGSLTGLVTNAKTGSVVVGARVNIGGITATSDNTGHYSIGDLSPGSYVLTASASGYLPRSYNATITPGATMSQNITLSTAGVLQGTVKNSSGAGVAGASVNITGGVLGASYSVTTGSGGSFAFGWIPVGTYVVTASSSGVTSAAINATINTGQTTTLAIPIAPQYGSVTGTVTSATDGHPLAGVTVSAGSAMATSDSNGNYTFASLSPATYTLTASSSGRLSAKTVVTLSAGAQLTANFRLSTAGMLKGRVVGSTGSGLAGATIAFTGGLLNTSGSVITDSLGNYSVGWVPIGQYTVTSMYGGVTKASSGTVSAGGVSVVNFTF